LPVGSAISLPDGISLLQSGNCPDTDISVYLFSTLKSDECLWAEEPEWIDRDLSKISNSIKSSISRGA